VAEVMNVSGKVSVPHNGVKRGDHVRLLVDGRIGAESITDTAHEGTEFKLTIKAETGVLLYGDDFGYFDNAIADAKAAAGEDDPRQGTLEDGEDETLPVGEDE
jgi:hypothetical protein